MTIAKQMCRWAGAALLTATLAAPSLQAQKPSTAPANPAESAAATDAVREQLLTLLRVSPTLTAVVASDPSLLANNEYVARTNPVLAQFLQQHPEIGRNPDFYLFADIHARGDQRVHALERRVWTGEPDMPRDSTVTRVADIITPALVGIAFFFGFGWLVRVLLANRRWNRVFRLQTEVHGKLIDRFGSSEEILTYMQTDAGKRFLEAAPISVDLQQQAQWPAALQRVLTPLTLGLVLTLLGLGMLYLRHTNVGREGQTLLTIFGIVALMPGLGCIIAAGITWMLVQRLGLMSNANRVD